MTEIVFEFNTKKAVEAILYLANRLPQPSILVIAKLLYFADKSSLERYGRFIAGDTYCAMQHGPVPSHSYDLMKAGRDTDSYGFTVEYSHHIKAVRDANMDYLSESDINCLDQSIQLYGRCPAWDIREKSHDAAWEQTWQEAGTQGSRPIPLERIISLFDDGDDLLDHLLNRHSD